MNKDRPVKNSTADANTNKGMSKNQDMAFLCPATQFNEQMITLEKVCGMNKARVGLSFMTLRKPPLSSVIFPTPSRHLSCDIWFNSAFTR